MSPLIDDEIRSALLGMRRAAELTEREVADARVDRADRAERRREVRPRGDRFELTAGAG
ncbi:hypothetical protein [Kitasatospora aureofaciens]|uniref:hypothetical protein n=1 Tax=Kitasatospora aureofaciens TaxID=1894 RepID=UPI0036F4638C